jgi:hypothetical protein
MAASFEVVCKVTGEDSSRKITALGVLLPDRTIEFRPIARVISEIEERHAEYLVPIPLGSQEAGESVEALLQVRRVGGVKFVQTKADDVRLDNLETLPEYIGEAGTYVLRRRGKRRRLRVLLARGSAGPDVAALYRCLRDRSLRGDQRRWAPGGVRTRI